MGVNTTTDPKVFQIVMKSVETLSGKSAPSALQPPTGTIDAIQSPLNNSGLDDFGITPLYGKDMPKNSAGYPEVVMEFIKPTCTYESSESAINICASLSDDPEPFGYLNATVDKLSYRQLQLNMEQFNTLLETPDSRLALRLIQKAGEIRVERNNMMAALIKANVGTYADDTNSATNPKQIPIVGLSNGSLIYRKGALSKVAMEYEDNGFMDQPILIGGQKIRFAQDAGKYGGYGPQAIGADTGAQEPVALFMDKYLDNTLDNGIENALSFMPGSIREVLWYKNAKYKTWSTPTKKKAIMPINGELYDFDSVFDECTEIWTITLAKRWGLWWIPQSAYDPCSKALRLGWELICGDDDCGSSRLIAASDNPA